MSTPGGGTSIYCPSCQEITKCRVPNDLHLEKSGNWKISPTSKETYFLRSRECIECSFLFQTMEIWTGSPIITDERTLDSLASQIKEIQEKLQTLEKFISSKSQEIQSPKPAKY